MIKIDTIEFSDLEVIEFLQKKGYRIEDYSYNTKWSRGSSDGLYSGETPHTIKIATNGSENDNIDKVNLEYKKVFKYLIEKKRKNDLLS